MLAEDAPLLSREVSLLLMYSYHGDGSMRVAVLAHAHEHGERRVVHIRVSTQGTYFSCCVPLGFLSHPYFYHVHLLKVAGGLGTPRLGLFGFYTL
jgi:hypothetical protein